MDQYIRQKFPYFKSGTNIYLDNAATTQLPSLVIQAMSDALAYRGNPYRGSHTLATANQAKLEEAKRIVASFIDASEEEIIFSANTTDSLNIVSSAISSIVLQGAEILVAATEHHSNLLPFLNFKGSNLIRISLDDKQLDVQDLIQKLSQKTKLVILQHCSNVTGAIQPIEKAISAIKNYNDDIFVVVDGAQMVAHRPISVRNLGCDAYAFSGHKMYGPDGIGVLYIAKKWHPILKTVRPGGGTVSDISFSPSDSNFVHPEYRPGLEKIIGGTPNVTGAIGLKRAIGFIRKLSWEAIIKHEQILKAHVYLQLREIPEIKILSDYTNSIGIISFSLRTSELNQKLADYLNKRKIAIRFGSHCSFGTRELLGSDSLRVSFAVYNTIEDIDFLVSTIKIFISRYIQPANSQNNNNIDIYKNRAFTSSSTLIKSNNEIIDYLGKINVKDTSLGVFAGHFLAIPDMDNNTFLPSIEPLLPNNLHAHLQEFGMTKFPLVTWNLGAELLSKFKNSNNGKLLIIANDTTGFNELYRSAQNTTNKTVEQYRHEFLGQFYNQELLPHIYRKILENNYLLDNDVLSSNAEICWRESQLRDRFQKFIRRNNENFSGLVEYTADKHNHFDLNINILNDAEIKTCSFNTFNSKTGGKFCIAELTQLLAELFGSEIDYDYTSEKVKNPRFNQTKNTFVIYSPAMCSNAVNKAFELYIKIFTKPDSNKVYNFINIPLGPESLDNLHNGAVLYHISNKKHAGHFE